MKERATSTSSPRSGPPTSGRCSPTLGGKAILGVNLESDSKRLASAEVADFDPYVGPSLIDAFELGNEPEFFPVALPRRHGPHDYPYKIAHYGKEFSTIASALGGAPLAGPGSGAPNWLSQLGTVLGDMPSRLKLVTVHAYPMKNCSRLSAVSVSDFFARSSIQGLADAIHEAGQGGRRPRQAAAGRRDQRRVLRWEGRGLQLLRRGAVGAERAAGALAGRRPGRQLPDDRRRPEPDDPRQALRLRAGRVSVQPEYYGLLAFADAAPAGSRLLRISDPGLAHFYQFAVRAPDGSERVVLTNVGSAARTVGVTASGTRGTGSLSLLSATSLSATGGTTLAGQSLSSRTGQLTGAPRLTLVRPNAKGVYAVRVPAHAAAILTLSA